MALLDEIGDYLSSQGVGTVGTTLFLGQMPDTPDAAVAVLEYGGVEPVRTMSSSPAYERPRIQITARAATYPVARSKAQQAWNALDGIGNRNLGSPGVRYVFIEALQSPFSIGSDQNGRARSAFNCQIMKQVSSS